MTATHTPQTLDDTSAESFRRMDESTAEQWQVIGMNTFQNQGRVGDRFLNLLESLQTIGDGFITDQLTHALQTGTMAERDGASEELIFAALCHDIGKAISVPNHAAIGAEILHPYVSEDIYQAILYHQDFQGKHYYNHMNRPTDLRDQHKGESWFEICAQLTDDWDQQAFDPDYDTLPLSHFEPLVREMTGKPRFI